MGTKNTYIYKDLDFSNVRHGRLTAVKKADFGRSQYICKCDCGNTVILPINKFLINKSCGCLEIENRNKMHLLTSKHNKTNTRIYRIWCGIKERCYNTHSRRFKYYGGNGICVCDEWKNDFMSFYNWAINNGYSDNKSIDRIDLHDNYCPTNCKWSNQTEQVRNRSITRWVNYKGNRINPYDFAKMFNITNKVFVYRHLDRGETGETIIEKWRRLHSKKNEVLQNI